MTQQDEAICALWAKRREQGVPPHLRLEQDNKSEAEWHELWLIDWHISQQEAGTL